MIAYLFDLDGTLVRAGGAGARSLSAAFLARHGVADASRGVRFHGRTDPAIVADMFAGALGRPPTTDEVDELLADYLARLAPECEGPGFRVLPDADLLLRWLGARPEVRLGVATGNIERGAQIKLARAGLAQHFGFGGYGCDSSSRPALVAAAIRRAGVSEGDRVVVVGDTVLDIEAAQANGALCVAVTTGGDERATLEAAGADVVIDRLAEVIDWHQARFDG